LSSLVLSIANSLADDATFLSFDDYANLRNFLNEVRRLSSLEPAQSFWPPFLYSREILKNPQPETVDSVSKKTGKCPLVHQLTQYKVQLSKRARKKHSQLQPSHNLFVSIATNFPMTMKTQGRLGFTDPTDNREADMCIQIPSDLGFVSGSAGTSSTSDSTATKSHDAGVLTRAVNVESLCFRFMKEWLALMWLQTSTRPCPAIMPSSQNIVDSYQCMESVCR
jgi:hypothetical protein